MRQIVQRLRAAIYDTAIVGMTAGWYGAVLQRLPGHCRLLDVGIGTGSALLANGDQVRALDLTVTGVDIDAAYVERCRRETQRLGMSERIKVGLESIYEHRGGPYDAVYFSASFMLLPDPPAALRHVATLMVPDGRIYFTQTFEQRRSPLLETIKPLLRLITTIDFGRVTYEADFQRALEAGGVLIEERQILHASHHRAALLISARPR